MDDIVESESPMQLDTDKLSELYQKVLAVKEKLKKHHVMTNNEASNVNSVLQIKDLEERFIALTSYNTFLDNFIKPSKEWLTDKQVADEIADVNSATKEIKEKHKSVKEEEDVVIDKFRKYESFLKEAAPCLEVDKEIKMKQKKLNELLEKRKMQLKHFPETCKNSDDAEKLIKEQKEKNGKLRDALSVIVSPDEEDLQQQEEINRKLRSLLDFNKEQSVADSNDVKTSADENISPCVYETYGGLKLIDAQPHFDIIEVSYKNSSGRQSSVEVKITFCKGRSFENIMHEKIKSISIAHCPVKVDDLIERAVARNNFAIVLPCLQIRLSESQ